jgi:hypothetical protein
MDIKIKVTGLDEIQRKLKKMAKAGDPNEIARTWRALRCPVHHRAPTNVRVVGSEVKAEFCCAVARERASDAVGEGINRAIR